MKVSKSVDKAHDATVEAVGNAKEYIVKSAETIKDLHAGDVVRISGYIYTARDAAHKRLYEAIQNCFGCSAGDCDSIYEYTYGDFGCEKDE